MTSVQTLSIFKQDKPQLSRIYNSQNRLQPIMPLKFSSFYFSKRGGGKKILNREIFSFVKVSFLVHDQMKDDILTNSLILYIKRKIVSILYLI
jgi:hypothetical protein